MTRPQPTPSDRTRAVQLTDGMDADPEWIERHRAKSERQFATAEMQLRQHAEHKARFADKPSKVAA